MDVPSNPNSSSVSDSSVIARAQPDPGNEVITEGFRPTLTQAGAASSIFRFSADRAANERFLKEELQPIFWYAKGIAVKPGVGEVYAEHPLDGAPDGRKAPLLVLGRFGAGRTLPKPEKLGKASFAGPAFSPFSSRQTRLRKNKSRRL